MIDVNIKDVLYGNRRGVTLHERAEVGAFRQRFLGSGPQSEKCHEGNSWPRVEYLPFTDRFSPYNFPSLIFLWSFREYRYRYRKRAGDSSIVAAYSMCSC